MWHAEESRDNACLEYQAEFLFCAKITDRRSPELGAGCAAE